MEIWQISLVTVPVLFGAGITVMAMPVSIPKEFQIARTCFWIAALNLALVINESFIAHSLQIRLAVAVLSSAAIGFVLGSLLNWIRARESRVRIEALENDPFTKAFRALQEKQARIQMGLEPESVEYERRRWMGALIKEYISSHDNVSPAIVAGKESPPTEWLNKRISELNEAFRKQGKSFRLPPVGKHQQMALPDRTLAFARSICEDWQDKPEMDLPSFQRRYLYTQSLGAAHSTRAYWILHRAKQHSECHMVARNLLERIFNSRVAIKSPRHAVELIASELSDHIHRLRLWQAYQQNPPSGATALIEDSEKELQQFLAMLGISDAPQWDYFRRAAEANITWAYRNLYFEFSCYTHAGYGRSRSSEINKPWKVSDFIALLAPIDTALQFHRLSCSGEPCKEAADYAALYNEIKSQTLAEPITQVGGGA